MTTQEVEDLASWLEDATRDVPTHTLLNVLARIRDARIDEAAARSNVIALNAMRAQDAVNRAFERRD